MAHNPTPMRARVILHPNWLMDNANNGAKMPQKPKPAYMKARARLLFLINQLAMAAVGTRKWPKLIPIAITKNEP